MASAVGLTSYGFTGRFASWEAAAAQAEGYGALAILAAAEAAAREVREGRAAFERDGIAFDKPDYAWPELACLQRAALHDGALRVLDIGGALGGFRRQHESWLAAVNGLRWAVVEQGHFVEAGRRSWQDAVQSFHPGVPEAASEVDPTLVLFSSVLQYLPDPAAMVGACLATRASWFVVARTPVGETPGESWVTMQTVRRPAPGARYPMRVFDEAPLLALFEGCTLLARLPGPATDRGGFGFGFQGYLLGRHGAS